jgi:hypothetical protein
MRRIFLIILLAAICVARLGAVTVTDTLYENARHLVVKTRTATYWYDMSGGGISRMIDESGNDWITFKREPWNKVPGSAASSFRGIPNAVYQGSDGGCGHPGFDKCISSYEAPNTIRAKSLSGLWEWTWTFFEDYAEWNVLKTDTSRCYWFLYEGPAGGIFQPENSFWGNNDGFPRFETPDHMKGEGITGKWDWICFGHNESEVLLCAIHCTPDDKTDWFSYMGNSIAGLKAEDGMVVFGFGREEGSKPSLKGNHRFRIGFINANIETSFKTVKRKILKP